MAQITVTKELHTKLKRESKRKEMTLQGFVKTLIIAGLKKQE